MTTFMIESVNVTASVISTNLVAGDIIEFTPQGVVSQVDVWAVSSAANVSIIVMADSDTVINDQEILFLGTTIDNFAHKIASFLAAPGTRLTLKLHETAGTGTQDVLVKMTSEPV